MIRSIWRTQDRDLAKLARDIALVCVADALVGASFGAIAVGLGLPLWLPMLMSVLVFAGAAQFLFIGIVGAGGNPVAAVAAGLLVNVRHVPFGFAVGDVLSGSGRLRRIAGSHVMVDETVAFTLAQRGSARRRTAYWTCGAGLFASWNLGVVAGAFGGRAIGDTDAFGLDAAFPAVLLALLLPSLDRARTRRAALAGVAVALATTPFLPAGLPVLLALAGIAAGLPTRIERPAHGGPSATEDSADADDGTHDGSGSCDGAYDGSGSYDSPGADNDPGAVRAHGTHGTPVAGRTLSAGRTPGAHPLHKEAGR